MKYYFNDWQRDRHKLAVAIVIQFDWSIIVIADRISLCQDPGVTPDDVFYSDASVLICFQV